MEITEEYISGYLDAISRVKDILTPNLGGVNGFFSIPRHNQKTALQNIQQFLIDNKKYYSDFYTEDQFQTKLNEIQLERMEPWQDKLKDQLLKWTCDQTLEKINGKHGYYLAQYLVDFLLTHFFGPEDVRVYHMSPELDIYHWGDQMRDDFIFETDNHIYIMHFGEST